MGLYDSKRSSGSLYGGSSGGNDELNNRIRNAKFRLEQSGVNPDADKRNWLEQKMNLKEDQNWFFDTLDVLSRPLYGTMNSIQDGLVKKDNDNTLEDFWEGLSGKERTTGSDVLDDMGVENKYGKAIGGFAADVALDPLNLLGVGLIDDVVKAGGKGLGKGIGSLAEKSKVTNKAKDALGNMFNTTYKMDKTLDGDRGVEELMKIRRKTLDDTRNLQDQFFNDTTEATKMAGGLDKGVDVGRIMEGVGDDITDDNLKKSASVLDKNNKLLIQLAKDRGLKEIPDSPDYMTHVLSDNAKKFVKDNGQLVSSGRKRIGGDKKVVSERFYKMPVKEANEAIKKDKGIDFDWFNPNAFEATAEGQRRTLNYILAESAKKDILENPQFARKVSNDMKLPEDGDYTLIQPDQYKFFSREMEDGSEMIGAKKGEKYAVTKGAKRVLDQFNERLTDEGIKQFMNGYDKIHNTWKKFALFSPAFHARNFVGNAFNMFASGMGRSDLVKYLGKDSVVDIRKAKKGNPSEMYQKFKEQGLREGNIFDNEFMFGEPDKALQRRLKIEGNTLGKLKRTPFEASRDLGTNADEVARYALFKWAMENPKKAFGKKLNVTNKDDLAPLAAEKVREVLFDYNELTQFERRAKRLIPFYTWMRNNIPYQLSTILKNPARYTEVEKARQAAMDLTGMEDENLPEWLKESMAIPVSGNEQEGTGNLLGLNLPLTDLAKLDDPMKLASSSLTPLLKLPIELGSNFNTFTQKPIEEFEGQKSNLFGKEVDPKTAHAVNSLLGSVGNVSRNFESGSSDGTNGSLKDLFAVKDYNEKRQKMFNNFDELDRLEALMKVFKQQNGGRPPTLRELEEMGIELPWKN